MQEEHIYELPNLKEAVEGNSQYEIPSMFTPVSVSASAAHQDKSKLKKPVCSWLWMCALVGFILVGSAAFASLALTVWNSSQVNHQSAKLEMEDMIMQLQNTISGLEKSLNSSISEYERRITRLQNSISGLETSVNGSISEYERRLQNSISGLETSVNGSISEMKGNIMQLQNSLNYSISKVERIVQIQNFLNDRIELQRQLSYSLLGRNSINPASSCSHILLFNSSSPSGHYWIRSSNGSAVRVYCDFNKKCGCDGPSGWTRVAFLNMSDPNQVCPSNWTYISSPMRTCGRGRTSGGGCNSVFYSTYGMTYTRVCGHIIAYQHGSPDAFNTGNDINGVYIDGVSLTHGSDGSRQHIWSFVSSGGEVISSGSICTCSSSNPWPHSTSFVGDDYFCDSGNHVNTTSTTTFYDGDPLWDGQGCGPSSTCCQFNDPPWFCKTLPQSTTDDLEVRICKNFNDEDIPIQFVELYVQ